ncbi:MAG: hypothetical protein MHM6MM_002579 [Cercozoa sp. M6MM]
MNLSAWTEFWGRISDAFGQDRVDILINTALSELLTQKKDEALRLSAEQIMSAESGLLASTRGLLQKLFHFLAGDNDFIKLWQFHDFAAYSVSLELESIYKFMEEGLRHDEVPLDADISEDMFLKYWQQALHLPDGLKLITLAIESTSRVLHLDDEDIEVSEPSSSEKSYASSASSLGRKIRLKMSEEEPVTTLLSQQRHRELPKHLLQSLREVYEHLELHHCGKDHALSFADFVLLQTLLLEGAMKSILIQAKKLASVVNSTSQRA